MTPFNRTVITVAGIILIIVLVVVLFLVLSGATEDKFPPTIPTCPDYWTVSNDDQGNIICRSKSGINTDGPNNVSVFNYAIDCPNFDIKNMETLACPGGALRDWADRNGVHWDGVTNRKDCPAEEEEEEDNKIKVPNSVIAAVVVGAIIIVCVSISAKK